MDSSDTPTRCGFIGLGSLGRPIARRIAGAGYPLIIWDMNSDALAPFAGTSVQVAANVADVGARADHVGICVLDDAGVVAVCRELLPAMRTGGRIAIHSTIAPATVKVLAADAAVHGIAVIDAPTTGIEGAADAGELAVMVGGDPGPVAAAWPIFQTFGTLILHLGGVGAALPAKLIHNGLLAANMAAADHAFAAGEALGIDRQVLAAILRHGSGRSYGLDLLSGLARVGDFAHGAVLLQKDVTLLAGISADPAAAALRDSAMPFLRKVREEGGKKV